MTKDDAVKEVYDRLNALEESIHLLDKKTDAHYTALLQNYIKGLHWTIDYIKNAESK